MVSNVTMETKVRTLPYLNNLNNTVLLYNVSKVGELVISRTCFRSFLRPQSVHKRKRKPCLKVLYTIPQTVCRMLIKFTVKILY
jgi:hypothetical protein